MIGAMGIEIRELSVADREDLWRLRLESLVSEPRAFGESAEEHREMPLEKFAKRLDRSSEHSFVLGAFDGSRLVGMAGFYRNRNLKERHKGGIWGVFVQPAYRGKGLGRALVSGILDRVRQIPGLTQIQLCVAATQKAARTSYEKLGFREFGVEPRSLLVDGEYIDETHMILIVE